jgi:HPt (histidine-containing phosphotransfer) domain-containing protein
MTHAEKLDALEIWSTLAAEELQQFCDEAQDAAGNPDGEDQLQATRALLADLDKILMPELTGYALYKKNHPDAA